MSIWPVEQNKKKTKNPQKLQYRDLFKDAKMKGPALKLGTLRGQKSFLDISKTFEILLSIIEAKMFITTF